MLGARGGNDGGGDLGARRGGAELKSVRPAAAVVGAVLGAVSAPYRSRIGSRFVILLTGHPARQETGRLPLGVLPAQAHSLGMRTLVADDNTEVRGALGLLLKELGRREIVEAEDFSAALEACGRLEPGSAIDLVLLDWELPSGTRRPPDAPAFVAALRQAAPHCRVVALSARPEAEAESLASGCDAFVNRTDPPDRLVALILGLSDPDKDRAAG